MTLFTSPAHRALTAMLTDLCGRGWALNVWRAPDGRGGEARVYLSSASGAEFRLYVTGNAQVAAGTLIVKDRPSQPLPDTALAELVMRHAHAAFPNGVNIEASCDVLSEADRAALPPDYLAARGAAGAPGPAGLAETPPDCA